MRISGASEQDPPEGFRARVRSALAWRWGSQLVAQFITWGSTIIVVRLLDPSDYGLFAMSQVFVNALYILNGWSFASSLIQADIFDHMLAILPEFGLRTFQHPSGQDFAQLAIRAE